MLPAAAAQEPTPPSPEGMEQRLADLAQALEEAQAGGYYAEPVAQAGGGPRPPDPFRRLDDLLPTPTEARLASGAPGSAYWQQKVDYRIRARLDETTHEISGVEDVVYHNRSPHALDYLWVQLDDNWLAPDSLDLRATTVADLGGVEAWNLMDWFARQQFDGAVKVEEVSAQGAELPTLIRDTMMRVDLPQPLAPGASFEFRIRWRVTLNPAHLADSRAGVEEFGDESPIFEAAHWYPRLCVYDDVEGWQNKQFQGNGEFALEFGDFVVELTVPADHVVAATGEIVNPDEVLTPEQRARRAAALQPGTAAPTFVVTPEEAEAAIAAGPQGGEKTWRFAAANVRDFAWASSRRFMWDCWGVQLRDGGPVIAAQSYWPPEGEPLWSRFSTRAIAHALRVYSRHTFDYPYPQASSVNGPVFGMEYPMICFNAPRPTPWNDAKDDEYALVGVVIHEVGHNWFPMIVNSDERQWTWMDEGLNSFVESIAAREWDPDFPLFGGGPAEIAMALSLGDAQPLMTSSDGTVNFGWNGYAKPAAGLHLLRNAVLGPELFDSAFRTYARRWMFKRPQPADFFRTLEDASAVDLDWFWRGWFYETSWVDLSLESVSELPAATIEEAGALVGTYAYVATVENDGGLIVPLLFELRLLDGTLETRVVPVEVWRRDPRRVEVILVTGAPVAHVTLDPSQLTYDAHTFDNSLAPGQPQGDEKTGSTLVEILRGLHEAGDPNYEIPYEDE